MAGLDSGDTIEIERGLVELSYESGALVVIEGAAWYEVRSNASGRLTRGRAAAKTVHPKPRPGEERWPQFTILTPSSVVHDLRTEFGMEVHRSSGLAAVHVFEGLVELASDNRATAVTIYHDPLRGSGPLAGNRKDDKAVVVPKP